MQPPDAPLLHLESGDPADFTSVLGNPLAYVLDSPEAICILICLFYGNEHLLLSAM